jgi:two-component system response regulator AtoC
MRRVPVLVVDDEENLRLVVRSFLRRDGYEVETAASGEEALRLIESFGPDVILTDVRMPKMGGMDLLSTLKAKGSSEITVIVMSAYGSLDLALEAIKAGAYDYIPKPFKPEELLLTLRKAEERESLRGRTAPSQEIRDKARFEDLLAKSPEMQAVFKTVAKVADYKTTALITGESGVGKELVARALHFRSGRKKAPFVAVNCGAIPEACSRASSSATGAAPSPTRRPIDGALRAGARGDPAARRDRRAAALPAGEAAARAARGDDPPPRRRQGHQGRRAHPRRDPPRPRRRDRRPGASARTSSTGSTCCPIRIPPLRERREDIPLLIDHFIARNNIRLSARRSAGCRPRRASC